MLDALLISIQLSAFIVNLLMAGYLLNRSNFHPLSIATAGMLISFALILADLLLAAVDSTPAWLGRLLWAAYPLPVIAWLRAVILLYPDSLALDRAWWSLLLPLTMLLILGGWIGDELMNFASRERGQLYWTFSLYNLLGMLLAVALLHHHLKTLTVQDRAYRPIYWLRLAGLFFSGALILLLAGVSPRWVFTLMVLDVAILGAGMIAYDAIAEGQSVRRDLGFTLVKTLGLILLLVLPWALAISLAEAWTPMLIAALLLTLGLIALGTSLLEDVEAWLMRHLFPRAQAEQETRETLRTLMRNNARRADSAPEITQLQAEEFTRLTRRALSHLPNLPRLAASPLTEMQLIRERLEPDANSLQRAGELRLLLAECIDTLRPAKGGNFGVSDEWRFFNALYYPYVLGISPYKRDPVHGTQDAELQAVLEWFRVAVPQRTLYNWQNRGAELIASILLEKERSTHSQN